MPDTLATYYDIARIQRAQAREMGLTILLDEITRRGWQVLPPYLPMNWPPLAEDDDADTHDGDNPAGAVE